MSEPVTAPDWKLNNLRHALEACRDQFQFYADEHMRSAKLEKAQTNQKYADLCNAALDKNK